MVHVGPKTFLSPKIPELATARGVFPCQVTLDEIRPQRVQSQGFLVDYCPHYLLPPVRLTIAAALLVANEARCRGRYIRVFFLQSRGALACDGVDEGGQERLRVRL